MYAIGIKVRRGEKNFGIEAMLNSDDLRIEEIDCFIEGFIRWILKSTYSNIKNSITLDKQV